MPATTELFSTSAVGQQIYTRLSALEASEAGKLPLAGGVLTGPLTGTTAGFSGLVNAAFLQVAGAAVATQGYVTTAISPYAPLAGAAFTGNVSMPGLTTSGTITSGGTITQGGLPVATQSYVTAQLAAKANLSGAAFTGQISVATASDVKIALYGSNNPQVIASDASGNNLGNFGFSPGLGAIQIPSGSIFLGVGGIGMMQFSVSQTGITTSVPLAVVDANFGLSIPTSNPVVTFDSGGDYVFYDRTANQFVFVIANVRVASIDASGNLKIKGSLTQNTTP